MALRIENVQVPQLTTTLESVHMVAQTIQTIGHRQEWLEKVQADMSMQLSLMNPRSQAATSTPVLVGAHCVAAEAPAMVTSLLSCIRSESMQALMTWTLCSWDWVCLSASRSAWAAMYWVLVLLCASHSAFNSLATWA